MSRDRCGKKTSRGMAPYPTKAATLSRIKNASSIAFSDDKKKKKKQKTMRTGRRQDRREKVPAARRKVNTHTIHFFLCGVSLFDPRQAEGSLVDENCPWYAAKPTRERIIIVHSTLAGGGGGERGKGLLNTYPSPPIRSIFCRPWRGNARPLYNPCFLSLL